MDKPRHTTPIVILGTGGNCVDILDLLRDINAAADGRRYRCIGFLDDDEETWGTSVGGLEVLGGLSEISTLNGAVKVVNGIASPEKITVRQCIHQRLDLQTDRYATLIHPTASVAESASVGAGTVAFQNVVIGSNTRIGQQVLVLPNSIVSHDSRIGSFSTIAGGVSVSGSVQVGDACYIGTNAGLKERICIGSYSLIGLGSAVIRDVEKSSVVAGNPACRIGASEDYLA